MLQKTLLFLGMIAFFLSGCQEDEGMLPATDPETQTITFGLSVNPKIEQGTDYVPMDTRSLTRANPTRISITNTFKYIIAKKVDSKLIIEEVNKGVIDTEQSPFSRTEIYEGTSYDCLSVELRPGNYEIFFFTGYNSVKWNDSLKKGDVISDSNIADFAPPKAFEMRLGGHWTAPYDRIVQEEIFFGREAFTVQKTTDLHSYPNTHKIPIKLNRRVTKFRTAIADDPTDGSKRVSDIASLAVLIRVTIEKQDGSAFANGLNVFGNLWYDPDIELKTLQVVTMTGKDPYEALDGKNYYISRNGETVYAPYILTEPGIKLPITTGFIDGSMQQGVPRLIYHGNHDFILNHNSIDGFVFRITHEQGYYPGESSPPYLLEPVYKSESVLLNATDLYESNYEYNYN